MFPPLALGGCRLVRGLIQGSGTCDRFTPRRATPPKAWLSAGAGESVQAPRLPEAVVRPDRDAIGHSSVEVLPELDREAAAPLALVAEYSSG